MQDKNDSGIARFRVPWGIRIVLSSLMLAIILWFLPMREVWGAIGQVQLSLWLSVLAAFLLLHVVAATKWWLLTGRNNEVPFALALKSHFVGLMANLCLPGVAGGDVIRASFVIRECQRKSRVAVGSIADRLLDILGLLLLSSAGGLFVLERRSWLEGPLREAAIVVLVLAGSILFVPIVLSKLPRIAVVEKLRNMMLEFKREPGKLGICFGLSVFVQSVFIGLNISLASAAGVEASLAAWFFAWPLAKLAAMVPVSLGGLGVREASLAALLVPFGAAASKVIGVGLLWQTILFAGGLLGGIAALLSPRLRLSAAANS